MASFQDEMAEICNGLAAMVLTKLRFSHLQHDYLAHCEFIIAFGRLCHVDWRHGVFSDRHGTGGT